MTEKNDNSESGAGTNDAPRDQAPRRRSGKRKNRRRRRNSEAPPGHQIRERGDFAAKQSGVDSSSDRVSDVEEKTLGPGRKRRIFKRPSRDGAVESSDQVTGEPKRPDKKTVKKDGETARVKGQVSGRRRNRQPVGDGAKDERSSSRKGRAGRSSRGGTRGRGDNRHQRDGVNQADFRPAPDAPDGVFTEDDLPRMTVSPFGRMDTEEGEANRVTKADYFSGKKGEDFSTMDVADVQFLKPHEVDESEFFEGLPVLDARALPDGELMDVAGIKTHRSGSIDPYDCDGMIVEKGDEVIVETDRGMALGTVVISTTRRYMKSRKVPKVSRPIGDNDVRQKERNALKVRDAFAICQQRIADLRLNMKLVEVSFLHSGNRAVFFFMADGRVDFRDLVKALARELHIRVEMRQIGVRDASKMIGGIGTCGHVLCCSRYLREFHPVSIRMAKDQDLVLNPEKVSGQCGRLMCCLAYEDKVYRETGRQMPKVGKFVETPRGCGRVRDRNILQGDLRVQLDGESGFASFKADEVVKITKGDWERKRQEQSKEMAEDRSRGREKRSSAARTESSRSDGAPPASSDEKD